MPSEEVLDERLEEQLAEWREEQHRVASRVAVLDDPPSATEDAVFGLRYKVVPNGNHADRLYGGVDVSFPKREGDPSVAVYVVVRGGEVVYHDSEEFILRMPYVSSYLSFREIDPLERLVKKQMSERPELTPRAILVDGNGIMHTRRAGIACFLGVRTSLRTIGVAKSLYCQDGLSTNLVCAGVERHVRTFQALCRENVLFVSDKEKLRRERGLVVGQHFIDAGCSPDEQEELLSGGKDKNDLKSAVQELSPFCNGFAVKLKGADGTVWGAALLAHGGKICSRGKRADSGGTKLPIYVSVGHNVSLEEAVQVCAELAAARIPEPVRLADLSGRELMRQAAERHSSP